MDSFRKIALGFVVAATLLATLGCAGERLNVVPHGHFNPTAESSDAAPPSTITAHVSNCADTDSDGNPIIDCFIEFVPVGPDGKHDFTPQRYPNVRDNVRAYPAADGNLTVELSPGSYNVWIWSSHIMQGRVLMGIGIGAGARLSLELNASQ